MSYPNGPYDPQRPAESVPPPVYPGDPQAYAAEEEAASAPTNDPRLGLAVGRYWGGALATVIIAALIGLVAWFVIERVANQDLQNPPFGGGAMGWAVAGGLFALLAAVLLHLFVVATPRPSSFFGWVVALATIIMAALPFTGGDVTIGDVLTAVVWIVLGAAVWSLLTGVLSRTVIRRAPTL